MSWVFIPWYSVFIHSEVAMTEVCLAAGAFVYCIGSFCCDEVRPCSKLCGTAAHTSKIQVRDTTASTSCALVPWCFILHQSEITMRNVSQSLIPTLVLSMCFSSDVVKWTKLVKYKMRKACMDEACLNGKYLQKSSGIQGFVAAN